MRLVSMIVMGAAMLAASPAMATDWRLLTSAVGKGGEGAYYLVDRDSIVRKDGRADASIYLIAENVAMNITIEFDCPARRFRPTGGTLINNGEKVTIGLESWQDNPTDSHATLFNYVCGFDKTKPDTLQSYGAGDPVVAIRKQLAKEK